MREVGRGAFGTVFETTVGGKLVAMKHMQSEDERLTDSVVREVSLMNRINHPNIVKLVTWRTGRNGHVYTAAICMEFAGRQNLFDWYAAGGAARMDDRYDILASIVDALAYLHAQDIVHGDIKLDNVMRDEGGRVRLVDFGSARSMLDLEKPIRGTRPYMPPEILCSESKGCPKADMWSLGVIAYALALNSFPVRSACHEDPAFNVAFRLQKAGQPVIKSFAHAYKPFVDTRRLCAVEAELIGGCLHIARQRRWSSITARKVMIPRWAQPPSSS